MGILPLEFLPGKNASNLKLDGTEKFDIKDIFPLSPGKLIKIVAHRKNQDSIVFDVKTRIDTPIEIKYFHDGGIMNHILKGLNS
jgi:aconitate hydratase